MENKSLLSNRTTFHVQTPLVRNYELSHSNSDETNKTNIFFKLENTQPSGSFKLRGIGHMIVTKFESGELKQIVASSGGNAGAAAAYTSDQLGINAKIFVPKSTNEIFIKKLREYNAEVIVHGDAWDETDVEARRVCAMLDSAGYIPPFDHELIWTGNSSMIDELKVQMKDKVPDCIIASVGGGGLMCGIVEGLIRHGWIDRNIKIVAVETEGADCFNQSIKANKLVTLDSITSIAKSLGAKTCSKKLFEYYNSYRDKFESLVLSDEQSVKGTLDFLDDHKMLVEPSCGVSIYVAYNLKKFFTQRFENIVVIACGGTALNLSSLTNFKKQFDL